MMVRPSERVLALHVITKLAVGGAQRVAVELAGMLPAFGFECRVVAGIERDEEGSLLDDVLRRGIPVDSVRFLVRRPAPLHDILALGGLVRLFLRERPLVVHTHSSKAGILGRTAAWLTRVPVRVHTVHGWSFEQLDVRFLPHIYRRLERVLARVTSAIVVVTPELRDVGLAAGVGTPDQYRVIRAGVDLGRFRIRDDGRRSARELIGSPEDRRIVGTVMRLAAPKDPGTLLEAIQRLEDVELVVVGDGPLRGALEDRVAALGMGGRVRFLGSRDDVAAILPAFDVFVLASKAEALPLSVVEAMASGVAVVATAVGGVEDLLARGRAGMCVPPGDPGRIASAVEEVLSDEALRARLISEGAAVAAGFEVATMAERTAELYLTLH